MHVFVKLSISVTEWERYMTVKDLSFILFENNLNAGRAMSDTMEHLFYVAPSIFRLQL